MEPSAQQAKDRTRWRWQWRERMEDSAERDRNRARKRLRALIAKGRVARGCCVVCERPGAQAHHPDYSRPRLVVWLCPLHHRRLHKSITDGDTEAAFAIEARAVELTTQRRNQKPWRLWPPERREEFVRRLAAGETHAAVAAHFGIRKSTVSSYRKRFRLPPQSPCELKEAA